MKLATLVYVQRNGQTLMLHRVKKQNDMHQGKWNGLGGKLEPGETPEECAVREVREESGLVARNPRLRGILTFPAFAKEEDWYVYLFTIHDFEGDLHPPAHSVGGQLGLDRQRGAAGLESMARRPYFSAVAQSAPLLFGQIYLSRRRIGRPCGRLSSSKRKQRVRLSIVIELKLTVLDHEITRYYDSIHRIQKVTHERTQDSAADIIPLKRAAMNLW